MNLHSSQSSPLFCELELNEVPIFHLQRVECDEGVPEGVVAVVDGDEGQGPAEAHQQSQVGEHGEERDLFTGFDLKRH